MTIHQSGNWAFGRGGEPPFADGDTITCANLAQVLPDTPVCEGVRGLTFRGCNLVNVLIRPGWTVENCNTARIDFCSHEMPHLIRRGLPECPVDCRHRQADDIRELPPDMIEAEIGRGRLAPAALAVAATVDVTNARGLLVARNLRVPLRRYANRVLAATREMS
ncbi:MAG TPA: hypothetical protein VMW52_04460 [Phycisphaerae bacterium]|nr:hypothetical protein [Phycisphaerae bacterium]